MNVGALQSRVRNRVGTPSDDQGLPVNMLTDFINEANLQIAMEHDWPWRFTSTTLPTVAGTGSYALPANHLRTRVLRIAAQRPLRERTLFDLETSFSDDATRGQPTDYTVEGANLLLRPIPNAAYTINHWYLRVEPAVSKDSDIPLMPEMFQTSIVELASFLAFRKIGNTEQAAICEAAYQKWLGKMHDKVRKTRQTLAPMVRPGAWENV
jgi:hypothetical protein